MFKVVCFKCAAAVKLCCLDSSQVWRMENWKQVSGPSGQSWFSAVLLFIQNIYCKSQPVILQSYKSTNVSKTQQMGNKQAYVHWCSYLMWSNTTVHYRHHRLLGRHFLSCETDLRPPTHYFSHSAVSNFVSGILCHRTKTPPSSWTYKN